MKDFLSTPHCGVFTKVNSLGDSHSRPFLQVSILGYSCSGLLDSGSEISIIGADTSSLWSDRVTISQPDRIDSIIAANGTRSPISGFMFLPVTVKGRTEVIKFYVIPGVTTRLIFGINFWQLFNIAPDVLSLLGRGSVADTVTPQISEVRCIHPFEDLSGEQRTVADDVIRQFEEISFEKKGLGRTSVLSHTIETGNTIPIKQRYYCLSPERLKELNRQLDEMLALDVVEPSTSAWNNPVTMAPKANGELRFCLDSRKLNEVSKHDAYPLPYISNILDQLRNARYLSSIDLKAAFWQIPLTDENSKEKTAFTIPNRGLFQFKVMCFGLTSAPATQQRLMDRLFGPEFDGKLFIYLDDIIVISETFQQHIELLLKVLERLKFANLTVNLSKCSFFRRQLKYLGYVVDESGLRTDPDKVKAIVEFPVPACKKDVKRFLGTASYYRRFIKGFSSLAAPLNALTSSRKDAPPFSWSPEADLAFIKLKACLTTAPVLACPDFSLPFTVHSDASEFGIGGMLTQCFDGEEHPIAFCSRSLNKQERNYSATEREALAVVFSVEHFRPYVEGSRSFLIVTDHASLKWFLNLKNPSGRLERWGCRLSPFNFTIQHRRGTENVVPDALSRSVPVLAIDSVTEDSWYCNIFSRCRDRPQTCPNFQIIDGKLFRYTKSNYPGLTGDFDWKEVVPFPLRRDLIQQFHDSPLGAHFGVERTYKKLRQHYYWPGMHAEVVRFVGDCSICKAYKTPNQSTPGLLGQPKVCRRPFQCLSMDLVGPLPASRQQHTFLLVVVCCFTKYCLLFPLRRATGKIISQRLEDQVFMVHGIPQTVIADNGPQFISRELKSLFEKYHIPQIHYTPTYCPQVNTVERYNRTVVTAIAALVGSDHRAWDVNIFQIQFAVNTAVNETTGFTPYLLVHGREAVVDGKVYGESSFPLKDLRFDSRTEFVDKLDVLGAVFSRVDSSLQKSHGRSAKYYNRSRRDLEFAENDWVWRRTHQRSSADKYFSAKLAPKFERCRVVRKISRLVYLLEDGGGRRSECHIKDLKGVG